MDRTFVTPSPRYFLAPLIDTGYINHIMTAFRIVAVSLEKLGPRYLALLNGPLG